MFDNGSEITLVSSIFAKKNNLPFEQATYTLAGIGSNATTYNNRKIYTISLVYPNGEIILVKAFSVDTILTEENRTEGSRLQQGRFSSSIKSSLRRSC